MSEWITDRLPTEGDAMADGCVWMMNSDGCVVRFWPYEAVELGRPWHPIPRPAPYVKPKRWTVEWHTRDLGWKLWDWDFPLYILQGLTEDDSDAAQRIADIYNEVQP
jgi:hypothetical protein